MERLSLDELAEVDRLAELVRSIRDGNPPRFYSAMREREVKGANLFYTEMRKEGGGYKPSTTFYIPVGSSAKPRYTSQYPGAEYKSFAKYDQAIAYLQAKGSNTQPVFRRQGSSVRSESDTDADSLRTMRTETGYYPRSTVVPVVVPVFWSSLPT